jgi:hypothetical protein
MVVLIAPPFVSSLSHLRRATAVAKVQMAAAAQEKHILLAALASAGLASQPAGSGQFRRSTNVRGSSGRPRG